LSEVSEFVSRIKAAGRRLLVCEKEPDFSAFENTVFVMEIQEETGVAGGRAGGMGSRRVVQVVAYKTTPHSAQKLFESSDPSVLSLFEIPYHATAMDVILQDGSTVVSSGVVDQDLVNEYLRVTKLI
jgi:hypothetical protein